jgi:hydrogenase maturation protease
MPGPPPLLIGVGNRHRHDDALGLEVAARLRPRVGDRARVVPFEGESTGLLDLWAGEPFVVLVDAVQSRGTAGRVHRIDGDLSPLLSEPVPSSTHGLGVGEAWRLGRSLGQLPERIVVFGVEGEDFTPGVGLSPAVARSLPALADAVEQELRRERSPARSESSHA